MAVTVIAAWLVASRSERRRAAGFWWFLASNVLWVVWGWHAQAYALIVLQLALAAMNIRGAQSERSVSAPRRAWPRAWGLRKRSPRCTFLQSAAPRSCLLALLLAACGSSTRLVYEQGDAALLLMADRYLNLEGPQWKVANQSIKRFHAWHRRTELPRYAELLQSAAGRVQRGLTRDDVEWAMQSLRARYGALVEAAVREAEPFLDTLDAENVAALERRFAANDRKDARELASGDPAEARSRPSASDREAPGGMDRPGHRRAGGDRAAASCWRRPTIRARPTS